MARRRVLEDRRGVDAAPDELRRLTFDDWPGPLLCDLEGHCQINGHGPHDDDCRKLSARRRWTEARSDYWAAGGRL